MPLKKKSKYWAVSFGEWVEIRQGRRPVRKTTAVKINATRELPRMERTYNGDGTPNYHYVNDKVSVRQNLTVTCHVGGVVRACMPYAKFYKATRIHMIKNKVVRVPTEVVATLLKEA